jgi:hypothetical protein
MRRLYNGTVREDAKSVARGVLTLLEELEEQQHAKVLDVARASVPRITTDDLKNPDDHPSLHHDPRFNYEDGVLAGIRASGAAIRALLASDRDGRS